MKSVTALKMMLKKKMPKSVTAEALRKAEEKWKVKNNNKGKFSQLNNEFC